MSTSSSHPVTTECNLSSDAFVRAAFVFVAARTRCSTNDFVPMQILVARDPAAFLFTGRATDRSEWAACSMAGRQVGRVQLGHFRAAVSGHNLEVKYNLLTGMDGVDNMYHLPS